MVDATERRQPTLAFMHLATTMSGLGFKALSTENWLEPELFLSAIQTLSPIDGTIVEISREQWLSRFLKPQLNATVPVEVRKLFEVARGAATYGYFFWPLYTLAGQQLYRVAEAAASLKCKSLGASRRKTRTFEQKISFLSDRNVIQQDAWIWWDSIRQLRNLASHPESQTIVMPHDTLYDLSSVAQHINDLFANDAA